MDNVVIGVVPNLSPPVPVIESPGAVELTAVALAPSVRVVAVVLAVGALVVLANPDNNPNPEAEVLVIGAEKPRESPGAAELVGAAAPPNLVPPPRVSTPEGVVVDAAPRVRPEVVPPSVNPVPADVVAAVAVPEPKANAGVAVVTVGAASLFPPSVNPCDGAAPSVKPPA